jgi:DNA-binding NarL/FixJ family response regulator
MVSAALDDKDVRKSTVGVLVVDDQRVFRDVAREVIEATAPFELLGEASSGVQALTAVEALRPALVLLDVRMPGMDGITVANHIRACDAETVVVLISVEERPNLPLAVRSCGAAALLRKQDFGPALLRSVWQQHGHGRGQKGASRSGDAP